MKRTLLALLLLAACSPPAAPTLDGLTIISEDPSDSPLRDITTEFDVRFNAGDKLFDKPYFPAQGLGPYYIKESCATCHQNDGKGPGTVTKMAVMEEDGFTTSPDQSLLPFGHTQRPLTTSDAAKGLFAPVDSRIKKSVRIGPAVFGRGYMEAILDSEIERMEAEQTLRTDGISGRINRVIYRSEANPDVRFHSHRTGEENLIGRFGVKARISTLDEFTADAFQGDMGITTPMRPNELPNPVGLTDDGFPGIDVGIDVVNLLGDYLRILDIPKRAQATEEGQAAFAAAQCSVCHVSAMVTRADYPISALAGIDAKIYSDLLLHDMGPALADGINEDTATSREWRTPPLMGIRFMRNFMHDGRAQSVSAAISHHKDDGSEGNASVAIFEAMSDREREALVTFVEGL